MSVTAQQEFCFTCKFRGQPTPLRFDRYRVEDWLGAGAFGEVWRCNQPGLERSVALKHMRGTSSSDPGVVETAANEMREGGKLGDEHFVRAFDASPEDRWIVFEYVSGGSLAARLVDDPQWVRSNFLRLSRELAEALVIAHSQQLMHRDIKPENILLTEDGHLKLADFGLARRLSEAELATSRAGSPVYMAPEALAGSRYGLDVDLHSVGVVFYEMLTCRRPYKANTLPGLIIEKESEAYERIQPDQSISRALVRLIDQLLASPEKRLQSAEVLLAKLTQLDPSSTSGNTIDDMQIRLSRLYGTRSVNRSPLLLLVRLNASLHGLTGGLTYPPSEYSTNRVEAYFPRTFSWICAACSSINIRLSQLLWLKYNASCPYCMVSECVCDNANRGDVPTRNQDLLARMRERSLEIAAPPRTFLEYYEELDSIYGHRDGTSAEVSYHALVEVAEAMDALVRLPSLRLLDDVVVLHLELADVVAWFFALVRVYMKQKPSYFFPAEFDKFFAAGCYVCEEQICSCDETEPELRMADWRPL